MYFSEHSIGRYRPKKGGWAVHILTDSGTANINLKTPPHPTVEADAQTGLGHKKHLPARLP